MSHTFRLHELLTRRVLARCFNDEQKNEIEKFVLQHPTLQDAFTLLKQTVLEPEEIVFADKVELYRKEERRIRPLFLRFAAAAALIGIVVLVWWMKAGDNIKHEVATVQQGSNNNAVPTDTTNKNVPQQLIKETPQQTDDIATVKQEPVKQNREVPVRNKKDKVTQPLIEAIPVSKEQDDIAVINNTDNGHVNDASRNPMTSVKDNTPDYTAIADNNTQHDNYNGVRFPENNGGTNTIDAGSKTNSLVQTAKYKELNTSEEDNQGAVYVGSLELNKNKVRGFMKKVGGLFSGKSKNATDEDGKLQIANLQLNTN